MERNMHTTIDISMALTSRGQISSSDCIDGEARLVEIANALAYIVLAIKAALHALYLSTPVFNK
jgi:hypothetical protein